MSVKATERSFLELTSSVGGLAPAGLPQLLADASRYRLHLEISQPAEIISGTGEGKQPPDFLEPSQLHLLQHADDLHPSKRLLHSLSFLLAQFVTDMPGGPSVDRTGTVRVVLRHMRRDVHPSEFPHELLRVIVLVPAQGHLLDARNLLRQEQPCISFRSAVGLRQHRLDQQSVAILDQDVAQVAQLGLTALRSEEHTSELQSRLHLVCRLLLEKKKKPISVECNVKVECAVRGATYC